MHTWMSVLVPIVALMIPMIIVPTAMGIRHARYLREVEHKERMRAMELGRTLPGEEPASPTSLAWWIGVGVPLGSLALALTGGSSSRALAEPLALAAALIGLGGVVGGTALAIREQSARLAAPPEGVLKSEYDPDAYDVVGRRG